MPELLRARASGVLLRLSMALIYDARIGFDFNAHWPHIQYIATGHALPPLDFNATAPHPPLYHLIAALVVGRGLDAGALGWMAALWGMLRLGLVWVGLEKWLPESRLARVVALALAAVLPAAAHLDGMITNETLVMLLSAAVLVVAPSAIAARANRPDRPDAGPGVLLALALMSKVSAPVLIGSVGAAIGLEIVRTRPPSVVDGRSRVRARRSSPVRWCWPPSRGRCSCATWPLYGQAAPSAYEGIAEAEPGAVRGDAVPRSRGRSASTWAGTSASTFARSTRRASSRTRASFPC